MKNQERYKSQILDREITPAEGTWQHIATQLEEAESRERRQKNRILFLAASLTAFLLGATFVWFLHVYPNPDLQLQAWQQPLKTPIAAPKWEKNTEVALASAVRKQPHQITLKPLTQSPGIVKNTTTVDEGLTQEAQKFLADAEEAYKAAKERAEVEQLMAEAEKSIMEAESQDLEDFIKAHRLLAYVERDMEGKNFRQQLWDKIKANYEKVELVVAHFK